MNREAECRVLEFPGSARGFVGTVTENFDMCSLGLRLEAVYSDSS